jgi:hypothetical protein
VIQANHEQQIQVLIAESTPKMEFGDSVLQQLFQLPTVALQAAVLIHMVALRGVDWSDKLESQLLSGMQSFSAVTSPDQDANSDNLLVRHQEEISAQQPS